MSSEAASSKLLHQLLGPENVQRWCLGCPLLLHQRFHRSTRFDPPVIPKDFVPLHEFPTPLDINNKFADTPPPEIPPPQDNNLKLLIEGVATLVARCGIIPVSLVSVLVPDWLIWLPYGIWFIFCVIVVRLKAWDLFTGFLPAQIAGPDNAN
ncbi:G patch domain-containing protein TGH [Camellia lanceoleosa]|uniref:G patch domain-containing protein TGH n=1 Tax=Camellia lanceoleosa TaxID=1840588 RepID=A0ACC0IGJ0_9ERIC|nr:G patch domain-containing protein TGH [Camellia lanceoleosa]